MTPAFRSGLLGLGWAGWGCGRSSSAARAFLQGQAQPGQGGWSESSPEAQGGRAETGLAAQSCSLKSWKPRDASEQNSQIRTQVDIFF